MADIVERLRHADEHSQQRVLGSRIFGEAANEIERLQRELALARSLRREELFPDMSSRIKAEREQARRKAFIEAAEIAENHSELRGIEWWLNATKKEVSADACRSIAAALRKAAEV